MRIHRAVRMVILLLLSGQLAGPTMTAGAVDLLPPPDPPRAALITVGQADAAGNAAVTGGPGAVPGGRPVLVLNLRTGHAGVTTARADGSFATSVIAPPGSFISVRYDPFSDSFIPQIYQEGGSHRLTRTPSTTLFVPPAPAPAGATAFAGTGQVQEGSAAWYHVQGTVSALAVAPGGQVTIEGTVRVFSPAIGSGFDARGVTAPDANVSLERLFDETGRQQRGKYQFMSRLLTPTGLPVEQFSSGPPPFGDQLPLGAFTLAGPNTIQATFRRAISIPTTLLPGWYTPIIGMLFQGVPNPDPAPPGLVEVEHKDLPPIDVARLPLLRVGAPAPPRLVWTLLADTPTNGTRGVVAQEDLPTFEIASRIIHNNDTYIVQRDDPRTGQPIGYRLGPFVPLLTQSDRRPIAPAIPFQFPSGSLTVSVTQPDGTTVALGTAPFAQSRSSSPVTTNGFLLDDDDGTIGDLFQLTTLSNRFLFRFAQYGWHVVSMTGSIQDVWGDTYTGTGTYEVFVARPLDLRFGAFPITPFSVGNTLSPVVNLMPPVPADLTIRLRLAPNGDAARIMDRRVTGQANAFGYFHPGAAGARLTLDQPGEYRVDVTAQYTDGQGVLWMGGRTWGSVVETPNGMLIAHGRRGIDDAPAIGQQWYTRRATGIPIGPNHIQYPFHSGDVMWASVSGQRAPDSATAAVSAQDPNGAVARIVQARGQFVNVAPPGDLSTRIAVGEMPLFISTPTGVNAAYDPSQIDQWGYTYRSAERPDLSVREVITQDMIPGPYWRFDEIYAAQPGVGTNGDLENELKFQFGGVVFRDRTSGINQFAGYGSLFVHVASTDPMGSRVFPPFQGNGGGPSGGPLMTLKGRPIDIFLVPLAVAPGTVLTVGDTFSFSAQVGPTLPSRVQVVVTAPERSQEK